MLKNHGVSSTISLALIGFLLVGLVVALFLIGQSQDIRQKAMLIASPPTGISVPLPVDSKSGCVFALRFDGIGETQALKQEALAMINSIKNQLQQGKDAADLHYEMTTGAAKEEIVARLKEYGQNREAFRSKYRGVVNPYEKFEVNWVPNFCFTNSTDRHARLGQFFYEVNPAFQTHFTSLEVGDVSEPFVIYTSSPGGEKEYAWMIVSRTQ